MKTKIRFTSMLLGLCAPAAMATTTFTSVHPDLYDGFVSTGNAPFTVGQTFSGMMAIQAATFHIDGDGTKTYHAYLAQWDTAANHLMPGTTVDLGATEIILGTYQQNAAVSFSFEEMALTDSNTYMLLLSYGSGSTAAVVDITDYGPVPDPEDPFGPYIPNPHDPDAFFSTGAAYWLGGNGYTTASAVDAAYSSGSYSVLGANYDLRMIVEGTSTAVPEPSGAILSAVGLGALFMRRRRK